MSGFVPAQDYRSSYSSVMMPPPSQFTTPPPQMVPPVGVSPPLAAYGVPMDPTHFSMPPPATSQALSAMQMQLPNGLSTSHAAALTTGNRATNNNFLPPNSISSMPSYVLYPQKVSNSNPSYLMPPPTSVPIPRAVKPPVTSRTQPPPTVAYPGRGSSQVTLNSGSRSRGPIAQRSVTSNKPANKSMVQDLTDPKTVAQMDEMKAMFGIPIKFEKPKKKSALVERYKKVVKNAKMAQSVIYRTKTPQLHLRNPHRATTNEIVNSVLSNGALYNNVSLRPQPGDSSRRRRPSRWEPQSGSLPQPPTSSTSPTDLRHSRDSRRRLPSRRSPSPGRQASSRQSSSADRPRRRSSPRRSPSRHHSRYTGYDSHRTRSPRRASLERPSTRSPRSPQDKPIQDKRGQTYESIGPQAEYFIGPDNKKYKLVLVEEERPRSRTRREAERPRAGDNTEPVDMDISDEESNQVRHSRYSHTSGSRSRPSGHHSRNSQRERRDSSSRHRQRPAPPDDRDSHSPRGNSHSPRGKQSVRFDCPPTHIVNPIGVMVDPPPPQRRTPLLPTPGIPPLELPPDQQHSPPSPARHRPPTEPNWQPAAPNSPSNSQEDYNDQVNISFIWCRSLGLAVAH